MKKGRLVALAGGMLGAFSVWLFQGFTSIFGMIASASVLVLITAFVAFTVADMKNQKAGND